MSRRDTPVYEKGEDYADEHLRESLAALRANPEFRAACLARLLQLVSEIARRIEQCEPVLCQLGDKDLAHDLASARWRFVKVWEDVERLPEMAEFLKLHTTTDHAEYRRLIGQLNLMAEAARVA